MFDAKRLLDQFISDPQSRAAIDSVIGGRTASERPRAGSDRWDLPVLGDVEKASFTKGALSGGLAGLVLGKKSKKFKGGGSAMQMGGLALIGTLDYKAYQTWQQSQAPSTVATSRQPAALPSPENTPFLPSSKDGQQFTARVLLQAMIAAAKADGHIDAQEQSRIFAELDRLDLDRDDKAFLMDELRKPLDIDALARAATSQELAVEIYTASLLAIDADNPAERGYLGLLAARLDLPQPLIEQMHATARTEAGVPA